MKLLMVIMMLFFSLLIGGSAFALTPDLELHRQAEDLSLALAENEMVPVGKEWHWDLIRVRTMIEAIVEVPHISKFSVSPEVEFHFVKK